MASGRILRTRRDSRLAEQLAGLLREARGTRSRVKLAEAAGVSDGTLGDIERARANPTLAYVEAVGELYGVELSLVSKRRRRRGASNGT